MGCARIPFVTHREIWRAMLPASTRSLAYRFARSERNGHHKPPPYLPQPPCRSLLTYHTCVLARKRNQNEPGMASPKSIKVSFQQGPVIVATLVDAALLSPTVPDPDADATRLNSALIVTGFTESVPEVSAVGSFRYRRRGVPLSSAWFDAVAVSHTVCRYSRIYIRVQPILPTPV